MNLRVYIEYKDVNWVMHITGYTHTPSERETSLSPYIPYGIDEIDGWVQIDPDFGAPVDPDVDQIIAIYRSFTNNRDFFEEIVENNLDFIADECYSFEKYEDYNYSVG